MLLNTTIKDGISDYDAEYINKLIESYRKNINSSNYNKTSDFSNTINQTVQELSDAFSISVITNAITDPIQDNLTLYYSKTYDINTNNTNTLILLLILLLIYSEFCKGFHPLRNLREI